MTKTKGFKYVCDGNSAILEVVPSFYDYPAKSPQGEWYIVPVKAEDVPNKNTSFVFLKKITEIGLPIDDPDSNIHKVVAEEIRIIGNQLYAFSGFMSHDEHAEVTWYGWATFIKNRAVRSVSVEGVD